MKSSDLDKKELEIVVNECMKIYHKYYKSLEEFINVQVRRCDDCGKIEIVDAEDELPTLTFKNIMNGEKTTMYMCEDCYDEHYEESEEYNQQEEDD